MILWVPIIAMIFAGFIFFLIALSDNDPGEKFFILKFLYGEYSLAFSFWGFGIGYIIFYTSLCLFTKYMPIPEMLGGIGIYLVNKHNDV